MQPDKNILQSKMFWANIVAGLASLFPSVQTVISNNPTEVAAGWTLVNVLLRVVTKSKVTLKP